VYETPGTVQYKIMQGGNSFPAPVGLPIVALGKKPGQPSSNPEVTPYKEQLKLLRDMGFYNEAKNLLSLKKTKGDLQGTVKLLLNV